MTVKEVVEAFSEFVKLFPEDVRRQVFQSKGYTAWCVKYSHIMTAPDDEQIG